MDTHIAAAITYRAAGEAARIAHEPCDAETHSWDHYPVVTVDPYWMRCHRLGPHTEHENRETGTIWT